MFVVHFEGKSGGDFLSFAEVDKDGIFTDSLKEICKNDKNHFEKRQTRSSSRLQSLNIRNPQSDVPIKEIDISNYKSPGDTTRAVINHLFKDKRVRLLNLFTQRAKDIAAVINSEFSSVNERNALYIEYILS